MKRILFIAAAALAAVACHEIPQDAHKSFAGKAEREVYDPSRFGNEAKFDQALDARARTQNEYVRMGERKAP
jgi:hypothetical protein